MRKIEAYIKKNWIKIFLLLCYLVFNFILLLGHELWRDEANVWLMARELSPVELLRNIKYQGHPCMWYFLVMPFAKAGFPFFTLSVISFIIMGITAWLFIWKAPIHPVVKFICLMSPCFSYYYPVVARNYCLIALLIVLLACFYKRRFEKSFVYAMLLGLLVQTDTIVVAVAGMISFLWLWDGLYAWIRKKEKDKLITVLKWIWIPVVSVVLLLLQFMNMTGSNEFQIQHFSCAEFVKAVKEMFFYILERMTGMNHTYICLWLFVFVLVALTISFLLKDGWPFILLVSAVMYQAVFSVVIYGLHIWHFISLCFVMIWFLWIVEVKMEQRQDGADDRWVKGSYICLQTLFALFLVGMFFRWNSPNETSSLKNALFGVYSDGENTAEFLSSNFSEDELLVSTEISKASTISAYLPDYDFYYAADKKIRTFASWNSEEGTAISLEEVIDWAENTFKDKQEFILVDCQGSCITDPEKLAEYEVIYTTTSNPAQNEFYTIYRIPVAGDISADGKSAYMVK